MFEFVLLLFLPGLGGCGGGGLVITTQKKVPTDNRFVVDMIFLQFPLFMYTVIFVRFQDKRFYAKNVHVVSFCPVRKHSISTLCILILLFR